VRKDQTAPLGLLMGTEQMFQLCPTKGSTVSKKPRPGTGQPDWLCMQSS
jgi:hypothetical protein